MLKQFKKYFAIFVVLFSPVLFAHYQPATVADQGMVVTENHLASEVGAKILSEGGNAIDAAVATGYALAVVDPCCGNIGGGGFMLIHLRDGQDIALDFRETAPAKINPNLFSGKNGHKSDKSLVGYLGVGVPGTVMGLNMALQKYGTMTLQQVMQPAIELAKKGYHLESTTVSLIAQSSKLFESQPNIEKIFMPGGRVPKDGTLLKQPELAKSLEGISRDGADYFYNGPIAKAIVAASEKNGGVLQLSDFANYHALWVKPIECHYRDNLIVTMPPPGSGITVCEILQIVEAYPLASYGFHSVAATHYNLEAMRYAYRDRSHYLADPAFADIPIERLLSKEYAAEIRSHISPDKAGNSRAITLEHSLNHEKMQTTHYVVVDKDRNAVSVTYTLNGYFGSKRIAGDTGFFLNNELDDFTLQPGVPNQFNLMQGKVNLIMPYKRPLSSMSPTMVFRHHKLIMVLGAAGGSTIITQIVETIENVIDFGMTLSEAVDSPRYHMQWLPDVTYYEPNAFSAGTLAALKTLGYPLEEGIWGRSTWGQTAAVMIDPETKLIYGANDVRKPNGAAVGVSNHSLEP